MHNSGSTRYARRMILRTLLIGNIASCGATNGGATIDVQSSLEYALQVQVDEREAYLLKPWRGSRCCQEPICQTDRDRLQHSRERVFQ